MPAARGGDESDGEYEEGCHWLCELGSSQKEKWGGGIMEPLAG